jgi:phosphotransferase system enzyme I (PtsP)
LDEGHKIIMPKIGIMVEVPAAVFQAYELAKRVDFMSVGSNDLIQYMLAVDRNNSRVADIYDGLHPAVLRALNQIVQDADKANCPVCICGELASDPAAVILLLAMGYSSMSMNAKSLLRVKWIVRTMSFKDAKSILKDVLLMDDAKEVRNHLEMILEEAGLGSLIRAGA